MGGPSALSTTSPGPGRYTIPHTITLSVSLPTTMNTRTPTCAGVRHRQLLHPPSLLHHGRGGKGNLFQAYVMRRPITLSPGCVHRDEGSQEEGHAHPSIHPPTLHSPHPHLRGRSICSHSYVLPESVPSVQKDSKISVPSSLLQPYRVPGSDSKRKRKRER